MNYAELTKTIQDVIKANNDAADALERLRMRLEYGGFNERHDLECWCCGKYGDWKPMKRRPFSVGKPCGICPACAGVDHSRDYMHPDDRRAEDAADDLADQINAETKERA